MKLKHVCVKKNSMKIILKMQICNKNQDNIEFPVHGNCFIRTEKNVIALDGLNQGISLLLHNREKSSLCLSDSAYGNNLSGCTSISSCKFINQMP